MASSAAHDAGEETGTTPPPSDAEHAAELADRVGGFQSHVNLIAYNPIEEEEFKRPTPQRIEAFRRVLERRGVAVSLRASRGLDQNAACGQLRRQQMAPNSSGSWTGGLMPCSSADC